MSSIHLVAITDLGEKKLVYHSRQHDLAAIKNEYEDIMQQIANDKQALFNLRIVYSYSSDDASLAKRDSYFSNAIYYHEFYGFIKTVKEIYFEKIKQEFS